VRRGRVGASPPPVLGRGDDVRRLRAFLDERRFGAEAVRELLRSGDELLSTPFDVPVHLRRLSHEPTSLATLVELFILGVAVPRARAEQHFEPLGLDLAAELGLVDVGEDVYARVRLIPHDELLIASDPSADRQADHVAGVHRPSATLAHLTVRTPVRRALDVGTGNGIQALLLAAHAEEVVATDVNERALAFAAFNAALNGIDNIELRAGSFLEPVQGERFDLVVANPPYVVSPENEYVFRDSGLGRDHVSEELVRVLPEVLADGAFATVMVSWIDGGEDPPRPAAWLAGSGCDAFILHSGTEEALASAAAWNRDAGSPREYRERLNHWADYYRDEEIDALGYGAIVLRRRSGANWVRALELPAGRLSPAEEHVARLFAAQDFLAGAPQLLEGRFAFVPGAGLEQRLGQGEASWTVQETVLVATEGLGFRIGLDPNTARIVAALRPDRPLRELLTGVAADIDADADAVLRAGAELLRRLLELGLLRPA
jgi:SAM-dependent methyltransferase